MYATEGCRDLHSSRQPITDVPAVYFMQASPENLQRLSQVYSRILDSHYILSATKSIGHAVGYV
jgi:hypothetical protein